MFTLRMKDSKVLICVFKSEKQLFNDHKKHLKSAFAVVESN